MFTETKDGVNITGNELSINCITSLQNKFNLDSEGNLTVNSITTNQDSEIIDSEFFLKIYPVGSIYISIDSKNPNLLFGGTWERIAQGRTLVGIDENDTDFNEASKIGGSKDLQEHYHDIRYYGPNGAGLSVSATGNGIGNLNVPSYEWTQNIENAFGSGSNLCTNYVGTGTSGNVQPYFTCYMWKRIS